MKLSEVNCLVNIYRISKPVNGESFSTGDRQEIAHNRRGAMKQGSTISVDTTYGNTTEGVWTLDLDPGDGGEWPGVQDVVTVQTVSYPNDPVRALEGRSLDVMEAVCDIKQIKLTLREARDS